MNELEQTNTPKDFMGESFGDNKANKSNELNESMCITETSQHGNSEAIHNIGAAR